MHQQILQGIALTHAHGIVPLVHGGACRPGNQCRIIGAVVRQHENPQKGGVIGLLLQTGDQIADDGGFVSGADQRRIAVRRRCVRLHFAAQPHHGDIEKLIGITHKKECGNHKVNDL